MTTEITTAADQYARVMEPAKERVTIRMLLDDETFSQSYDAIVDGFENRFNTQIEIDRLPWERTYERALLELTTDSDYFDIIGYDGTLGGPFGSLGKYVYLDDFAKERGYPSLTKNFYWRQLEHGSVHDGKLFSIFTVYNNRCLFYRKDLMTHLDERDNFQSQNGYDLPVPVKTWAELRDVATFFRRKPGDKLAGRVLQEDFFGISMGMAVEASYENAFNDRYHGLEPDEYEGNALTNWLWNLDTFEPVVNNPKALKALQDVVDLYNSGAVAPGSLKKLWMDQMDDISKGRVVMMINWPGVASSLTDKAVNPYADVMGYAPMPYWPERPGSRRIWGLSYPVGITKASKHKDEAYKWLWYATQPEQAIRLMRTKKMPSVCQKGVLDNQELWNEFPLLEPQYKNAKDDIGTPTVAEWFQIWNGIGASVQRAAEKNIEAAKALEEAETLLRDLFKERGYLK